MEVAVEVAVLVAGTHEHIAHTSRSVFAQGVRALVHSAHKCSILCTLAVVRVSCSPVSRIVESSGECD